MNTQTFASIAKGFDEKQKLQKIMASNPRPVYQSPEPLDAYQNKRYFLEVHSLTNVELHVVEKKELTKWLNEHPSAKCIDLNEYKKLVSTSLDTAEP